jgi:large subunit ribosomal protein L13
MCVGTSARPLGAAIARRYQGLAAVGAADIPCQACGALGVVSPGHTLQTRRGLNLRTSTRRLMTVRTFSPKAADVQRQWHVIDASDVVLGRLASHTATLLRGKHKPIFAPHVDTGDFVVIVNAAKVALTGNKLADKRAYRHSGYPGGLRSIAYGDLMAKNPERAVTKAVRGMLPKNTLGRQMLRKLKVYAGPEHPHQAQKPVPFEITQISQRAESH